MTLWSVSCSFDFPRSRPKSRMATAPLSSSLTFCDLRSRGVMPSLCAALAPETQQRLLVVGFPVGRENLEGDGIVQIQILRLEDDPHAAAPDGLLPSVAGQSLEEAFAKAFQVHALVPARRTPP